jgi:hypothetical protein
VSTLHTDSEGVTVEDLAPGAIEELLEKEARDVLGVSGAEFAQRWAAGEFVGNDDPRLTDLAMLLP